MTIALGCMGMSGIYGKTDDATSIAVIHAAIERGVTLLDTGDFYGAGHNELLVGKAIVGRRDQVQLSVKFGAPARPPTASPAASTRAPPRSRTSWPIRWCASAPITSMSTAPRALDPAGPDRGHDRRDRGIW